MDDEKRKERKKMSVSNGKKSGIWKLRVNGKKLDINRVTTQ